MKKDKKNIDWVRCRAMFITVLLTLMLKQYIFTENLVGDSLWKNIIITLVLYIPTYFLMIFIQRKCKSKK